MSYKELEEKILKLEGRIDELSKQVMELQKHSHPINFMPCRYEHDSPPFIPNRDWGPLGPVVTC